MDRELANMEPSSSSGDFSSIAAHLLFSKETDVCSDQADQLQSVRPARKYIVSNGKPIIPMQLTIADRIREISANQLKAPLAESYKIVRRRKLTAVGRPSLGKGAKVLIGRVRIFFDELRRHMGSSCRGTIFNCPLKMASMACGVAPVTVRRTLMKDDNHANMDPVTVRRRMKRLKAMPIPDMTMRRYKEEWEEVINSFIRELTNELMTVEVLHARLCSAYPNFPMSKATLFRFLKGIGFVCYRDGEHIRIII